MPYRRFMMCVFALFATLANPLQSAEVEPQATAIWPLPIPAWLREQVEPDGLTIASIVPGMPASLARLRVGDSCVMIAGMAPCSDREFVLCVRLAALHADNRGEILRGGTKEVIRLPAFMAWSRWGLSMKEAQLEPPATLPAADVANWLALPRRVQLVGLRAARSAADPAWMQYLIVLANATPGATLPATVAMPDPYLERVAQWWRICATTTGPVPAIADIDEALFRAAHLLWPKEPALDPGAINSGDADTDRLLLALAAGSAPNRNELAAAGQQLANQGLANVPGDGGRYLGQCLAAIIDGDNHGGWPYRSGLVWNATRRTQTLASLDAAVQQQPALADLAGLARIGPAVMSGDMTQLHTALAGVQRASPWLARHCVALAINAGRMHRKTPWLIGALRAAPATVITPELRRKLACLEQSPDTKADELLAPGAPHAHLCLAETWSLHAEWQRNLAVGGKLAEQLNELLWDVATDPAGRDADACLPLARQLVLTHGWNGTQHWESDSVAAAFARGGRNSDALFWQQAAMTQVRSAIMPEKKRDEAQAGYGVRLARLKAGGMIDDGAGEPTPAPPVVDGLGTSSGQMLDDRRVGPWITKDARGTIVQILGYNAGEPSGRWIAHAPDGSLGWSGWIADHTRVGWWRIATADGGEARGWYDGVEDGSRCGWWTIVGADGTVRAEGACRGGEVVAPWFTRLADGTSRPVEAATIILPADPPLPGETAGPGSGAF
jgi:hypothetical protein